VRAARVAFDVSRLHVALHAVDDHVLAVGVDPVWVTARAVGHQGREVKVTRLLEQREHVF